DRMDYLLRDSYHAGVAYGRFDQYRLIDTLRILPESEESNQPKLGVEHGGLHSAEQLLLARYFMFTQVYLHAVRRVYDHHLVQFLEKTLRNGKFPVELDKHLALTDTEILSQIRQASANDQHLAHQEARRISVRGLHFRPLWRRNPVDRQRN